MTALDLTVEQANWLDWRRHGLGGSDIGALLGLSKWQSPWSLWADKLGLLADTETTARQRIGHRMEAVLAAEFRDHTGLYIAGEQTRCTSKAWPIARCTIDGYVCEDPDDGEPLGIWEAKTDAHFSWPDGPPASYLAQARWNMMVTGTTACWLTVMFAGFRCETFEILQHQPDVDLMLDRAREFWQHIETGEPPPVDASDATTAAIGQAWPDHVSGVRAELDTISELVAERVGRKAQAKVLDDLIAEIDNEIKVLLADAEVGTVAGEPVVTWRQQAGRTSTCEACGHTKTGAPFRVLRTTKKGTK